MSIDSASLLAALTAGASCWCLGARPSRAPLVDRREAGSARRDRVPRILMCLGAGAGAALVHWGLALPVVVGSWWWLSRTPRPEKLGGGHDLPQLVALMVGPLRAGAAPITALRQAADALPGEAANRLWEPLAQLSVGMAPETVWHQLSSDPLLGELGQALARAHRSGAPLTPTVERLAKDLARRAATDIEDRARTVGVRAAVPLGLCLLPAFLLLGVVPLAAGLFGTILR